MPTETIPLHHLVTLFVKEGKRRILTLATIFAVVAVGTLAAGIFMPKRWDASALIVAHPRDIIKPLLEGRAVPTSTADQTAVVTQTLVSRRILREIAATGGWSQKGMSPAQEERLLTQIKMRIKIENQREDTIRISYYDTDPQRAYRITTKLADVFIRETLELKEAQSHDAFDFISRRVKEYAEKLSQAHAQVLAYYRGDGARTAALSAAPKTAPQQPLADGESERPRVRLSSEELDALRAQAATLTAQLAQKRPAVTSSVESRQLEDQYRARVLQLQADLDRLRATYTEEHPDVRHAQHELETAKGELARAERLRAEHEKGLATAAGLDDVVMRAAAVRLEEVQQKIAAATGVRVRTPGARAVAPVADTPADLEMKGIGQDTVLSELLRRYEATRDVYQDLLKRRENARVSMDLDSERRGFTLGIQEAPELPVASSSVRLMYIAMAGLVLAVLAPLGLLFALIRLDPRVRSPHQIERLAQLPLLVTIPARVGSRETTRQRTRWYVAGSIVVGVFMIYAAVLVVKMQTS